MEISPCRQCEHIAEDKSNFPACQQCPKIGGKTALMSESRAFIIDFKSIGGGGSKLNTDEDRGIKSFIERECEKAGVSVDRVLSFERKKELALIRRHLSIELKKRFSLTQARIAKELNLTVNSVSGYFKTLNNTNQKKTDPPSQTPPLNTANTLKSASNSLIIDFTDDVDLYKDFIKLANWNWRSIHNQIFYMISQAVRWHKKRGYIK